MPSLDSMLAVLQGLTQPLAPDDTRKQVDFWKRWKGAPPIVSSPEYEQAQREKQAAALSSALKQLSASTNPRPDLITPGSTGALENARPYTFAGRVVTNPNELPASVLARPATESPDAEGMGGLAQAAMKAGGASLAGFAPIVTKAQKKIAKAAFKAAPENIDLVNQIPQLLELAAERRVTPQGVPSGWFHGGSNKLGIDPAVMAGIVPQDPLAAAFAEALAQMQGIPAKALAKTGKTTSLGNLNRVAGHEVQHFVNKARTIPEMSARFSGTNTRPSTLINKIAPALSHEDGGAQIAALLKANEPIAALDEALAYLREATIANPGNKAVQALAGEFLPKPAPVVRGLTDIFDIPGLYRK